MNSQIKRCIGKVLRGRLRGYFGKVNAISVIAVEIIRYKVGC